MSLLLTVSFGNIFLAQSKETQKGKRGGGDIFVLVIYSSGTLMFSSNSVLNVSDKIFFNLHFSIRVDI